MGTQVLAGSKAKYIGNSSGWENRNGRECTVIEDTCCEAETMPVLFAGEKYSVRVYQHNLQFIDRKTRDY